MIPWWVFRLRLDCTEVGMSEGYGDRSTKMGVELWIWVDWALTSVSPARENYSYGAYFNFTLRLKTGVKNCLVGQYLTLSIDSMCSLTQSQIKLKSIF